MPRARAKLGVHQRRPWAPAAGAVDVDDAAGQVAVVEVGPNTSRAEQASNPQVDRFEATTSEAEAQEDHRQEEENNEPCNTYVDSLDK
jgi:hypothetical protein